MPIRKCLITLSTMFFILPVAMAALAQQDGSSLMPSVGAYRQSGNAGYVSKYALNETARRLAYQSKAFQRELERELNRSCLDGTPSERRANQLSVRFQQAAETLRSRYAVGRNVDNTTAEADNLFRLGSELGDFVLFGKFSQATLESWNAIGCDLSSLTNAYDFDTAAGEDAGIEALTPLHLEYHSAATSYGRIWRWPF